MRTMAAVSEVHSARQSVPTLRARPRPAAPSFGAPAHRSPDAQRLVALQQAAGNAAVAARLGGLTVHRAGSELVEPVILQRCGPARPDCGCTNDERAAAEESVAAGRSRPSPLQRLALQRDDEQGGGRVGAMTAELRRLEAAYAGGPQAALSMADAHTLDAKLAELRGSAGFERIPTLGLAVPGAAVTDATTFPLTGPIVLEIVEGIVAAVAALSLWEILLILALLLLIILLLKKAFEEPVVAPTPVPVDQPKQVPKQEPKQDPKKKKDDGQGPEVDPPLPGLRCTPTGLTPDDPIPITWFKPQVDDFYPRELRIQGHVYARDGEDHLPHGEPIGVAGHFWPTPGKIMQLIPTLRGPGADDFRAVLLRYGFDWSGLQADHVQDLEWEGDDAFHNLWPMDNSANLSAGARTNQQVIGVCLTPAGAYVTYTLQELKAAGLYGRFFAIRNVSR